jgi:hypothetical protein
MTKTNKRIVKVVLWGSVLAITYVAGVTSRGHDDFDKGYNTAMAYISTVLERRMAELEPFYMSDIGYRFIPRGNNIAKIQKIGQAETTQAKVAK